MVLKSSKLAILVNLFLLLDEAILIHSLKFAEARERNRFIDGNRE